jgi:hypothetical protein
VNPYLNFIRSHVREKTPLCQHPGFVRDANADEPASLISVLFSAVMNELSRSSPCIGYPQLSQFVPPSQQNIYSKKAPARVRLAVYSRFLLRRTGSTVVSLNEDPREPCGLTYAQLSNLSDDVVMAHLARGHGDAIAVLLDRYARLVETIAYRLVRSSAEAQDVAQEVFLGLCKTAARFNPAKGSTIESRII